MAKVAINGLGRIGRAAMKMVIDEPELTLVAVNDLMEPSNAAYLLEHDSAYGNYHHEVSHSEEGLEIDGKMYRYLQSKDPEDLPWEEMEVHTVFECTGVFRKKKELEKHLKAGAKRVILSAPPKDDETESLIPGVSFPDRAPDIFSCASCTTNCIAPVVEVIGRRIGISKAVMTTIHAYTSSQALVDGPASKVRRGRAAAMNLVPTTTGAALATTEVLPEFRGKFDGCAVRAPVVCGSMADITIVSRRSTMLDEVNRILKEEADTDRYRGILGVTEKPLVSSDIIGNSHASLVDLSMTQVIDEDLIKIMSWYDNEWGYTKQMVRSALKAL
ncbi:MAG: type I glyceraldehyde-3-phosphate dehydrogenase [Candidatus Aegiribacteria sp.]